MVPLGSHFLQPELQMSEAVTATLNYALEWTSLGQLVKHRHYAHPIKEDVKKKDFSPPLGEMRVW